MGGGETVSTKMNKCTKVLANSFGLQHLNKINTKNEKYINYTENEC